MENKSRRDLGTRDLPSHNRFEHFALLIICRVKMISEASLLGRRKYTVLKANHDKPSRDLLITYIHEIHCLFEENTLHGTLN